MIRLISLYGILAGLIVAIPLIAIMAVNPDEPPHQNAIYGYLTMLIALSAVFLGIKHYRDKVLGGVIRFLPALLVGLGISAVASVIYALGWELAVAVSGFDFGEFYSKFMIDAARTKGASAEEMQKVVESAQSFAKMYSNPLYRIPISFIEMFPVGVLISLVSAALLRNSRLLPAGTTAAN